ncbi:MAG: Holliday junction resolvase RuvX [Clostridia bacterium]|nr:Holliday junction resolvase RuvX [Clostridia bacterium]
MRIMGIDYGDSRVGVALSDPLGITAQGLATLPNKVYTKMLDALVSLVNEHGVEKIVLGMPKNLNGTSGDRAEVTETFRADLESRLDAVDIILWDERLTTVQAAGILNVTNTRGKDRKNVIDTVAASIILQSYLDYLKK